jgi:uncharacterized membrane protein SpoIIM required for sporulation
LAAVDEFISAQRPRWEELEALLRRAGRDPRRLEAAEIERLSQLYRQVTAHLAQARRDFPHDQVSRYLNDLAARAHPVLYRAPAGSWRRLYRFFLVEFPALFRSAGPFVLAASLLFSLPAVAGFLVALGDPQAVEQVLPGRLTRTVREGRLWTDISPEERALAASAIMTNNLQVGILAFAGGILLGTLTVYVLLLNGLFLGIVFGYTQVHGLALDLATFVSPHGYLELSVVFIAGGAGLMMAWAVLTPGLLSRREALGLAARRAVLLIVGAAPWLVLAGLIEAFISPSGLPREAKLLLGPLTAALFYAFLLLPPERWSGRRPGPGRSRAVEVGGRA